MNLKQSKTVARELRAIETDLVNLQRARAAGSLEDSKFAEHVALECSRGFAILAEHLDPDMPSEELESFRPGVRSLAPRVSPAPSGPVVRFKTAAEELEDEARDHAEAGERLLELAKKLREVPPGAKRRRGG